MIKVDKEGEVSCTVHKLKFVKYRKSDQTIFKFYRDNEHVLLEYIMHNHVCLLNVQRISGTFYNAA